MRVGEFVNGVMIYRDATPEEEAEWLRVSAELPPPEPTTEDRITALEQMNDMLLDMVAENTYELCLMSLGIDIEED